MLVGCAIILTVFDAPREVSKVPKNSLGWHFERTTDASQFSPPSQWRNDDIMQIMHFGVVQSFAVRNSVVHRDIAGDIAKIEDPSGSVQTSNSHNLDLPGQASPNKQSESLGG